MFDFDKKKIYLRGPDTMPDVVEWSIVLDIGLSDWYCSVSNVWVRIPSREIKQIVSSKI
jgi:hypothetical protein